MLILVSRKMREANSSIKEITVFSDKIEFIACVQVPCISVSWRQVRL